LRPAQAKKLARPYLKKHVRWWLPSVDYHTLARVGGSQSEAGPRQKHETLSEKQTKAKRIRGMDQVVEYLLSKYKTLS
jgi:hypothetical protein